MEPIKRCKPPDWVRTVVQVAYGIVIHILIGTGLIVAHICAIMKSIGELD